LGTFGLINGIKLFFRDGMNREYANPQNHIRDIDASAANAIVFYVLKRVD